MVMFCDEDRDNNAASCGSWLVDHDPQDLR